MFIFSISHNYWIAKHAQWKAAGARHIKFSHEITFCTHTHASVEPAVLQLSQIPSICACLTFHRLLYGALNVIKVNRAVCCDSRENSIVFPPHSLTPHSHFMSSWFLLPFYTLLAPTYYFISLCDNVLQKVEIPLVFVVRHRCCCCWLSLPTREKNAMMMISLCVESFSFVARAAHRRAEKYDDDEELEARLVCFMWFSQFPLVSLFYVYLQDTKHSANSHFAPIPPDLNSSSSIHWRWALI